MGASNDERRSTTEVHCRDTIVSFNLHTGYQGPWCFPKRWYSKEEEVPVSARHSRGHRCKLFLLLFRSYLRGNQVTLPRKVAPTHSSAVSKWVVSYKFHWTAEMIERVDSVIFTQLGRQANSTSDLDAIRAAKTG